MADLGGFDANQVEPNKGFGLVPRGDYDAIITDSEMKPTSAGTGKFLALTLQILSGEYQNRKLWENLNLENPNAETVQIAKGTLSAICRAVGVMTPKNSTELHNKPMKISIAIKKDKKTQQDVNRIVGFKPRNAGPATSSATTTADSASGQKVPW